MPEALSARGRRTQFLGILIVGGLILVALVSAVLWLSVAAGTAAIFFCMGVSFFALLAVYAGKLIVDEERYMQARLEARDARYRQTLELLPEGVVILKGEDGVIEWVNTMAGVHLGITSEDVGSVFTDRLIASQPAFCAWLRSRDFSRHYALETAGGSVLLDAAVVAPDERHTTSPNAAASTTCVETSSPTSPTSCARRSPSSRAFSIWRTWTCRPSSESAISPSCATRRPA